MLLDLQIADNKKKFIELVESIDREGFYKKELLDKLEKSDFYYAPASVKYHNSYKGGLCEHALSVYKNLCMLNKNFGTDFDEDSMKIVALFHDFSKMNFYETYFQNKKVYHDDGKKSDEGGRFDWEAVSAYKVKESCDRFVYGSHEQNSEFMIRYYCPLSYDESAAILHHHGGMSWDSAKDNISEVYERYSLALLLHLADMTSCYLGDCVSEDIQEDKEDEQHN